MNCIRCELPPGHGVVLVEIRDVHGGTYALCGTCFREREGIAPTARKGEKPAPFVRGKVPSEWLGGGR